MRDKGSNTAATYRVPMDLGDRLAKCSCGCRIPYKKTRRTRMARLDHCPWCGRRAWHRVAPIGARARRKAETRSPKAKTNPKTPIPKPRRRFRQVLLMPGLAAGLLWGIIAAAFGFREKS